MKEKKEARKAQDNSLCNTLMWCAIIQMWIILQIRLIADHPRPDKATGIHHGHRFKDGDSFCLKCGQNSSKLEYLQVRSLLQGSNGESGCPGNGKAHSCYLNHDTFLTVPNTFLWDIFIQVSLTGCQCPQIFLCFQMFLQIVDSDLNPAVITKERVRFRKGSEKGSVQGSQVTLYPGDVANILSALAGIGIRSCSILLMGGNLQCLQMKLR